MYPELNFIVIMLPYAMGIVLQQETFTKLHWA